MGMSLSDFLNSTRLNRCKTLKEPMGSIQRMLGLTGDQSERSPQRPIPAKSADGHAAPRHAGGLGRALGALPAHPAGFTEQVFKFSGEKYMYRLYVPGREQAALPLPLPLLVLLHGCQQDAADFAQGTAMNVLAEQEKCLVLYPEQLSSANSMRCWNWFEPAHQVRGAGEPAMIAALTRHVLDQHQGDPARVYIAGLSAGGAMAAVVAGSYPELYTALGVHSGLPPGAASNVMSAFGAMRRGARRATTPDEKSPVMPTIVFHGNADKTVHPDNGGQVVDAAIAALGATGLALAKTPRIEDRMACGKNNGRSAIRTVYSASDGKSHVEHWAIGAGPHAWSGGDAAGSFTDPQGPSASRAMLDFLLQHQKLARA